MPAKPLTTVEAAVLYAAAAIEREHAFAAVGSVGGINPVADARYGEAIGKERSAWDTLVALRGGCP